MTDTIYCVDLCSTEGQAVATNLAIDDELLAEAQAIAGLKTKRATVNEALREFIQRRKQIEALGLLGKIDFDPKYDHKRGRSRR